MYNIRYETSRQSRFDARYWMLGAGALGRPRGRVGEGGGWRVQDGEHMRNKGILKKGNSFTQRKTKILCPANLYHKK